MGSKKIQFKNKKKCFLKCLLYREPIPFRTSTPSLFCPVTVEVKKDIISAALVPWGSEGFPPGSAECSASPLSQVLWFVELTSTLLPWEAPSLNWLD